MRRVPLVGKKKALGQSGTGQPHFGSQIRYDEGDCRCERCRKAHEAWYEYTQNLPKAYGKFLNSGTKEKFCRRCGKIKRQCQFTGSHAFICNRCKKHRHDNRRKLEKQEIKDMQHGFQPFPEDR